MQIAEAQPHPHIVCLSSNTANGTASADFLCFDEEALDITSTVQH